MDQIRRIFLIAGLMLPAVPTIAAAAAGAPECLGFDQSAKAAGETQGLLPPTLCAKPIEAATPPEAARSANDGSDAARGAFWTETRDWRNLWSRTPVHKYEQPAPPPPPVAAPAPTYDDDDDWDRDDYLWVVFPRDKKPKGSRKHRRGDRDFARPDREVQVARGVRRDGSGRPRSLRFWEKHGAPGAARR